MHGIAPQQRTMASITYPLAVTLLLCITGCSNKPQRITIEPSLSEVAIGDVVQLHAIGHYAFGRTRPLEYLSWSSSNYHVININPDGAVFPLATGSAVLTATADGVSAQIPIKVIPTVAKSIVLDGASSIAKGTTAQVYADVTYNNHRTSRLYYTDGRTDNGTKPVWHSSNEDIAFVDDQGNVTMHSDSGSAIISATLDGVTGQLKVSAKPPSLYKVMISYTQRGEFNADGGNVWLRPGETLQLHAVGGNSDESQRALSNVSWTSDQPMIVSVSPSGFITSLAEGNAEITLRAEGMETTLNAVVDKNFGP